MSEQQLRILIKKLISIMSVTILIVMIVFFFLFSPDNEKGFIYILQLLVTGVIINIISSVIVFITLRTIFINGDIKSVDDPNNQINPKNSDQQDVIDIEASRALYHIISFLLKDKKLSNFDRIEIKELIFIIGRKNFISLSQVKEITDKLR